jgi:CBS domain-containing protein
MRSFQPVAAQRLSGPVLVARPAPPKSVTAESPALDAMTDLRYTHAAIIEPQQTMEAAHAYMMQRGVRLLLVMGPERALAGIITATDILGEKPLHFAQERRVKHSEILISDIMTPLDRLEAIPVDDLRSARVGQVIAFLREAGRQHALVKESDSAGRIIVCGIFSLSQIERQMGLAIQPSGVANTFAEIEAALLTS